jgi:hypothetical protein
MAAGGILWYCVRFFFLLMMFPDYLLIIINKGLQPLVLDCKYNENERMGSLFRNASILLAFDIAYCLDLQN